MKRHLFILLTTMIFFSGCASQSDIIILDERIADMEMELSQYSDISQTQAKKEKTLRSQSASLRVQLDDLRQELSQLNGKLEAIEYELKQEKKTFATLDKKSAAEIVALTALVKKNNERLQSIENYLNLESTSKGRIPTDTESKEGTPDISRLSDSDLYKTAKQAFDKGDFEAAREGFQELIKRYPLSKNADNAQFWIGEIYYREKWYEKAILEYQKVIEKYPEGNKAKDALLKQGYAFHNMGDNSSARLILKELIKKHPQSNQAKIAKQKLGQIK